MSEARTFRHCETRRVEAISTIYKQIATATPRNGVLLDNDLKTNESETTIELNFAVLKINIQ